MEEARGNQDWVWCHKIFIAIWYDIAPNKMFWSFDKASAWQYTNFQFYHLQIEF